MQNLSLFWKTSLGCFIVAAFTGFLYRLGLIGWLPGLLNLDLGNIRHAHSHLMFFGWAVPFPLFILLKLIIKKSGGLMTTGIRWMRTSLALSLILGILAFPFFLLYGYHPVPIGTLSLPLSVIISGLVMISWYTYAWGYCKSRAVLRGNSALPWFDGAIIMLVVSSVGAWGVALVQAVAPANQLFMKGLTHFFLGTFTEGWVVLAILAVIISKLPVTSSHWPIPEDIALGCITIGAPLTFAFGISESMLSPLLLMGARMGGLLVAVGVLLVCYVLVTSDQWKNKLWIWPLLLLVVKAVMQFSASVFPSLFWLANHGLRIFYLHILLLGAFTLTMTGWWHAQNKLPNIYFYGIIASILIVLLSLIFPTSLWPVMWSGVWIFYLLAFTALLPPVAILIVWIKRY